MRIMLRTNFGVKEQDLRHLNKRKLAACLAEQLLYETDDENDNGDEPTTATTTATTARK